MRRAYTIALLTLLLIPLALFLFVAAPRLGLLETFMGDYGSVMAGVDAPPWRYYYNEKYGPSSGPVDSTWILLFVGGYSWSNGMSNSPSQISASASKDGINWKPLSVSWQYSSYSMGGGDSAIYYRATFKPKDYGLDEGTWTIRVKAYWTFSARPEGNGWYKCETKIDLTPPQPPPPPPPPPPSWAGRLKVKNAAGTIVATDTTLCKITKLSENKYRLGFEDCPNLMDDWNEPVLVVTDCGGRFTILVENYEGLNKLADVYWDNVLIIPEAYKKIGMVYFAGGTPTLTVRIKGAWPGEVSLDGQKVPLQPVGGPFGGQAEARLTPQSLPKSLILLVSMEGQPKQNVKVKWNEQEILTDAAGRASLSGIEDRFDHLLEIDPSNLPGGGGQLSIILSSPSPRPVEDARFWLLVLTASIIMVVSAFALYRRFA